MFGCDFRGLVIDQGLGFSIHWLGFRVYAFSFVFCGREHKNHWKKMKNSEKTSKNRFFEIFRRLIFRHLDNQVGGGAVWNCHSLLGVRVPAELMNMNRGEIGM